VYLLITKPKVFNRLEVIIGDKADDFQRFLNLNLSNICPEISTTKFDAQKRTSKFEISMRKDPKNLQISKF
jgi:hypothetical protein